MEENENIIPPEITSLSISKNSLKKIVSERFGGRIESIDLENGSVDIVIPDSLLRSIIGNRYSGKIESVEITGNKVDIKVGDT